jgi:hypothetical protein
MKVQQSLTGVPSSTRPNLQLRAIGVGAAGYVQALKRAAVSRFAKQKGNLKQTYFVPKNLERADRTRAFRDDPRVEGRSVRSAAFDYHWCAVRVARRG